MTIFEKKLVFCGKIITDKNNISLYPYSMKNYRSEADKDYLHICETIDTTKQLRNLKYDNTQTANFNVFVLRAFEYTFCILFILCV